MSVMLFNGVSSRVSQGVYRALAPHVELSYVSCVRANYIDQASLISLEYNVAGSSLDALQCRQVLSPASQPAVFSFQQLLEAYPNFFGFLAA